jgi:hypothetical protein
MAKLLNDELTYVSFPITKFSEDADGNLIVKGTVTDGTVDSDRQIVDPKFSAKALSEWMDSGPNVRVMHSPTLYPAGRGLKVELGSTAHELEGLIVEDTAKKLVKNRVLRAWSVGIDEPVIKRDPTGKAPGGIIVGGRLAEVSLVDRPANKNCQLVLAKAEGHDVPWSYGDLDGLLTKSHSDGEPGGAGTDEEDAADAADADGDGGRDRADSGDSEPDDDETDDVKKSWRAARADWLAVEPRPGDVPMSSPAFLAKRAAWGRWHDDGEAAGLAEDGYETWLVKRDMDPNVGGGVDRDQLDAGDFVFGDERVFPVVEPGDVSDAVSSWGRYKGSHSFDEFKSRLVALCKRRGPEFVEELPVSWSVKVAAPDLVKGDKDCPNPDCGAEYHADSKLRRCSRCGTKLPKAESADKGKKPPFGGKPAKPFGAKPSEGSAEEEAGESADEEAAEDDEPGKKKPPAAKSDAPYAVVRMHDALCAAYHWDAVAAEYPALKGVTDAIDTAWWRTQVADAVTKGDMAAVADLAVAAQNAESLTKSAAEPEALADARAFLHKSFTDLYPNAHPTPTTVTPGAFQRPYINAGHAPLSARASQTPHIPAATHTPDPDQFDRGPLTAGHQAPSPSSSGDNNPVSSVATGAARTYYTRASRDAARNAMQAMHDHIAGTFPDMCPMAASRSVLPADMGDTNRPTPIPMPQATKASTEDTPTVTQIQGETKKLKARKADRPVTAGQVTAIVKSALVDQAKVHQTQIAALKAEIDELGAQPDPTQAPVRGVVRKAITTDSPAPVERASLVDQARASADAEQAEYVAYLQRLCKSDSPGVREQAHQQLSMLLKAS